MDKPFPYPTIVQRAVAPSLVTIPVGAGIAVIDSIQLDISDITGLVGPFSLQVEGAVTIMTISPLAGVGTTNLVFPKGLPLVDANGCRIQASMAVNAVDSNMSSLGTITVSYHYRRF